MDVEAVRGALDELFLLARHYRKSDKFQELLRFVASFRRYSVFNAMMVHIQMPGAQYVLPAKRWLKEYGRRPISDAQPLIMLQPMSPIMFGFDVSQTEGRPLPDGFEDPFKADGLLPHGAFELTTTRVNIVKKYNRSLFVAYLFLFIFLNGEAHAQLNWGLLTPRESVGDAFFRGQEEAQRMQMQQMQIENLRIQNEIQMGEIQRRESEIRQQQYEAEQARRRSEEERAITVALPQSPTVDPTVVAFNLAAASRKYLYPDFDSVAYAQDVTITIDMIKLMTGSPFAADIAYYLGKNKVEAAAISKMPMLQASKAIMNIEKAIEQLTSVPRRP